jgi:YidC/Oxa1 family membrane protein insertase
VTGSTPMAVATHRVHVVTDVLDVEIDTQGGDVRRADLLKFPVSTDHPEQPFRLLDDELRTYVAQSGILAEGGANAGPTHYAMFKAEQDEYRLSSGQDELTVTLSWQGDNGISARKTYTFRRGEYQITLKQDVANNSQAEWKGRAYQQLRHSQPGEGDTSRFVNTYLGGAWYSDKDKYQKLKFENMGKEPLKAEVKGGWVAVIQHYFVSAWIPDAQESDNYFSKQIAGSRGPEYLIGTSSSFKTAAPGATAHFESRLFVGPKLHKVLETTAPGMDLVVDYGVFTVFSKPLFLALSWLHTVIGNWGVAIIILTALIKLAFYKLSATSYKSMARMRAIQPRMVSLRERYGDDKVRMNQALMEMYKTEKINPLGGCLPIAVQIPVFIALYWVLLESVELRQAPFILWIHDLSTKDPFFVLPVLMGITMYLQQKLNPAPADPMQAKVFAIMPFVFTGMFSFSPAGLVLYWFVNNLLSIAQQWVITKRHGSPTTLPAKA